MTKTVEKLLAKRRDYLSGKSDMEKKKSDIANTRKVFSKWLKKEALASFKSFSGEHDLVYSFKLSKLNGKLLNSIFAGSEDLINTLDTKVITEESLIKSLPGLDKPFWNNFDGLLIQIESNELKIFVDSAKMK